MKSRHILIVGDANHYFNKKLAKHLKSKDRNLKITILSETHVQGSYPYDSIINISEESVEIIPFSKIPIVRNYLKRNIYRKKLISQLRTKKYTDIHLQSIQIWTYPVLKSFRNDINIIQTVWGSDFLRTKSFFKKLIIRKILNTSTVITVASSNLKEEISSVTNSKKIKIVRFGLDLLDEIDKIKFDRSDKDGINITIGYNRHPAQQHLSIIEEILKIPSEWLKKCKITLPLTYGPNDSFYQKSLTDMLEEGKVDFKVFDYFMDEKELAKLRLETDIMIQLQKTDQFSGSMQEHLYAGNIVITGKWLKYDDLIESGIKLKMINSIKDLHRCLLGILENNELLTRNDLRLINKEVIRELSSWEKNIDKWHELYS